MEEVKYISERLKEVKEYHLEAEVISSALSIMKSDSTMSISKAFELGCQEWDV